MTCPRVVISGLSPSLMGLQWESSKGLRIGRHGSTDIVLHDPAIARNHAEVAIRDGIWVVRDVARNARTPTYVNGKPVAEESHLHANDVLQCGGLALKATVVEGPEMAAPLAKEDRAVPGSCLKTTRTFLRVEAATQNSWDQTLH